MREIPFDAEVLTCEANSSDESTGLGVEVDVLDFGVGSHHDVLAPERIREHSIGDQMTALNVRFMDPLQKSSHPL